MGAILNIFQNCKPSIQSPNFFCPASRTYSEDLDNMEAIKIIKVHICGNGERKKKVIDLLFKSKISKPDLKEKGDTEYKSKDFYWITKIYEDEILNKEKCKKIEEIIENDKTDEDENNQINFHIMLLFGDNNDIEMILKEFSDINRPRIVFVTENKIEKSHQKTSSTFNIKKRSMISKVGKNLNTTTSKKNSNLKSKIFKTNTNKKMITSKRVFNIPSKKFNKPNLKKSDNTKCNTSANINNKNITNNNSLEDIKNNTIDNLKQKSVKFKQDETFDNEMKLCYTSSGDENNDNSSINSFNNKEKDKKSKDLEKANNKTKSNNSGSVSGNMSDTLSKGTNNIENLSSGNNSMILKKEKKIPSKKKPITTRKAFRVSTKKPALSKSTINIKKDVKGEKEAKEKEKEFTKLLKEMNEDYNNDIEMLKTQEEQIQLMLSLIDLNDDDDD